MSLCHSPGSGCGLTHRSASAAAPRWAGGSLPSLCLLLLGSLQTRTLTNLLPPSFLPSSAPHLETKRPFISVHTATSPRICPQFRFSFLHCWQRRNVQHHLEVRFRNDPPSTNKPTRGTFSISVARTVRTPARRFEALCAGESSVPHPH